MDIDFGTEAHLNIKYNYLQVFFFKKLLRVKNKFIAKQVKAMENILMLFIAKQLKSTKGTFLLNSWRCKFIPLLALWEINCIPMFF